MKNKKHITAVCFPLISKNILIFLMIFATFLQAGERPSWDFGDHPMAEDRVIVRLVDNANVGRSGRSVITLETVGDFLGVEISDALILNPAPENIARGSRSVALSESASGNRNNMLLVNLKETGRDAVKRALEILNANPLVKYAEPDLYMIMPDPIIEEKAVLQEFRASPRSSVPNDPRFSDFWHLQNMNVPAAWQITTGSRDIVVGIIDTPIRGNHPDLAANLWNNPNPNAFSGVVNDIHGFDFHRNQGGIPFPEADRDHRSHGTNVAGPIGAVGNNGIGGVGVNWEVSLASLGALESVSAQISAINYAGFHNIPILNASLSWGGSNISALHDAIRDYNGLFVVSAMNWGRNNDVNPSYPAAWMLPNLIAVAATGNSSPSGNQDQLGVWQNGSACFGRNTIEVAAPGVRILTTGVTADITTVNGSSYAAPSVAGIAALMLSVNPDLSPAEIRNIIIQTVRKVPALSDRLISGGIVDARAAVVAARDMASTPRTRINLSANTLSFDVGAVKTVNFSVTNPQGATTVSSSNPDVVSATISGNAVTVEGLNAGRAVITVTNNNTQAQIDVSVLRPWRVRVNSWESAGNDKFLASSLLDGNPETYWHSRWSTGSGHIRGESLADIDLRDEFTVNRIEIDRRLGDNRPNIRQVRIFTHPEQGNTFPNGENIPTDFPANVAQSVIDADFSMTGWTEVNINSAEISGLNTANTVVIDFPSATVTTRYIRIGITQGQASGDAGFTMISDIRILGAYPVPCAPCPDCKQCICICIDCIICPDCGECICACDDETSIRAPRPASSSRYGILLNPSIASEKVEISVRTPEPAQITLKILDNLGNPVHTVETQCLRLEPCEIVWNLTNSTGRFVGNGTYLIVVEATGISGRKFFYSSRIGVSR